VLKGIQEDGNILDPSYNKDKIFNQSKDMIDWSIREDTSIEASIKEGSQG